MPVRDFLAAVSVGKVDGELLLDLNYPEDSTAEVDMNVVMTRKGQIVEIQGTAEQAPFEKKEFDAMLRLATKGIKRLTQIQETVLGNIV
mgnify:FL=1